MQDNEVDDLFRSKLGGLEMEPPAQVWENIDNELNGRKRRLVLLPWLSVAASIVVLITAGILFIPREEVIVNKPHGKNELAQAQRVSPVTLKPGIGDSVSIASTTGSENIASVKAPVTYNSKKQAAEQPDINNSTEQQNIPVIANTEPVKMEEQPVMASVSPKLTDDKGDVVPGIETPLAEKPTSVAASNPSSEPVLAAVQLPPSNTPSRPLMKRHGIHNMGDLINLVVAKVDKRKDKLIQFTDDGDESSITGLHIGAIDIKKEAK